MLAQAQHAFSLLHERLQTMDLRDPNHEVSNPAKHDAMFIWSALHGLASLLHSDAAATIGLNEAERAIAVERVMRRMGLALNRDAERPGHIGGNGTR